MALLDNARGGAARTRPISHSCSACWPGVVWGRLATEHRYAGAEVEARRAALAERLGPHWDRYTAPEPRTSDLVQGEAGRHGATAPRLPYLARSPHAL